MRFSRQQKGKRFHRVYAFILHEILCTLEIDFKHTSDGTSFNAALLLKSKAWRLPPLILVPSIFLRLLTRFLELTKWHYNWTTIEITINNQQKISILCFVFLHRHSRSFSFTFLLIPLLPIDNTLTLYFSSTYFCFHSFTLSPRS